MNMIRRHRAAIELADVILAPWSRARRATRSTRRTARSATAVAVVLLVGLIVGACGGSVSPGPSPTPTAAPTEGPREHVLASLNEFDRFVNLVEMAGGIVDAGSVESTFGDPVREVGALAGHEKAWLAASGLPTYVREPYSSILDAFELVSDGWDPSDAEGSAVYMQLFKISLIVTLREKIQQVRELAISIR
jgi:hypothetical protein